MPFVCYLQPLYDHLPYFHVHYNKGFKSDVMFHDYICQLSSPWHRNNLHCVDNVLFLTPMASCQLADADLWPNAVSTMSDMKNYASTLFGRNCQIENLLAGTPFAKKGCHVIRVKEAGKKKDWPDWPKFIETAMQETVQIHNNNPEIIQARAKLQGAEKTRLYDTLQVTPSECKCRVPFGADKHHKSCCTSADTSTATLAMEKSLMAKVEVSGYGEKACHIVLNRYERNDGMIPHQDTSLTYDVKNPITSISYGRGALLTIHTSKKDKNDQVGIYYQYPNDAIIMSGEFNMKFFHGVPHMNKWKDLWHQSNIVRHLSNEEMQQACELLAQAQCDVRYNATIRWHEHHYEKCPCAGEKCVRVDSTVPKRKIMKKKSKAELEKTLTKETIEQFAKANSIVEPASEILAKNKLSHKRVKEMDITDSVPMDIMHETT